MKTLEENWLKQTRNAFLLFHIEVTYHSGASTWMFLRVFLTFVFSLVFNYPQNQAFGAFCGFNIIRKHEKIQVRVVIS